MLQQSEIILEKGKNYRIHRRGYKLLGKRHKTVSEEQNQLFILVIFLFSEKSLEPYFHSAKHYFSTRA